MLREPYFSYVFIKIIEIIVVFFISLHILLMALMAHASLEKSHNLEIVQSSTLFA